MAAVAFTAYGVHWWALGLSRAFGGDARPNAFMAVPFMALSAVGAIVFLGAHDNPVAGLFCGLFAVYVCGSSPASEWSVSAPSSGSGRSASSTSSLASG
jgi:hypothetical protein